jgi:hypothetical protein
MSGRNKKKQKTTSNDSTHACSTFLKYLTSQYYPGRQQQLWKYIQLSFIPIAFFLSPLLQSPERSRPVWTKSTPSRQKGIGSESTQIMSFYSGCFPDTRSNTLSSIFKATFLKKNDAQTPSQSLREAVTKGTRPQRTIASPAGHWHWRDICLPLTSWAQKTGRNQPLCQLRSKSWWFTEFCNSHHVAHLAAFFIEAETKTSIAKSCTEFCSS